MVTLREAAQQALEALVELRENSEGTTAKALAFSNDAMHALRAALAELRRLEALNAELVEALRKIDKECFSHIDGRDLFAQMHPRNTLDIKRRVDGRETWFEGDWLSDLWRAIKEARAVLAKVEASNG